MGFFSGKTKNNPKNLRNLFLGRTPGGGPSPKQVFGGFLDFKGFFFGKNLKKQKNLKTYFWAEPHGSGERGSLPKIVFFSAEAAAHAASASTHGARPSTLESLVSSAASVLEVGAEITLRRYPWGLAPSGRPVTCPLTPLWPSWLRQRTFNPTIVGSTPTGGTTTSTKERTRRPPCGGRLVLRTLIFKP